LRDVGKITAWMREAFGVLKTAVRKWRADQAQRLSAAIAFYTVFSLSPLLVIIIAVAGRIFGAEAVRGQIVGQFGSLIGLSAAKQIEDMIVHASNPRSNLLASTLGVAALLLGAAGVFGQIKGALDTVWRTESRPKRGGVWSFIRGNLLSLAMVLIVAFLLLVSLVFSAGISALIKWAGGAIPGSTGLALQMAEFGISFLVITVLFAMLYRILPETRISWADVWIGAAVTALLFDVGKLLIGLYLGRSSVASVFGAAGSLVVILVWVYYSATIFLFGAELTEVYAKSWGSLSPRSRGSLRRSHRNGRQDRGIADRPPAPH
jgi:membrane protein